MLETFKLEQIKIEAFAAPARNGQAIEVFEAMFNPTEIERRHNVQWSQVAIPNASGRELKYAYSEPEELKLHLTLDGTGADQLGATSLYRWTNKTLKSVGDRINLFKKVAYKYDSGIHEPLYLRASWGDQLNFNCRLRKLDIKYTLFNRDGSPLRAELDIVLISDEAVETLAKQENKQSPDITHARIVRAGDTLPLLTKSIYGSPERYLDVARFNDLEDFRALTPGQELLFPPLAAFGPKTSAQG